jgi:hypothetical protein
VADIKSESPAGFRRNPQAECNRCFSPINEGWFNEIIPLFLLAEVRLKNAA